MSVLRVGLAGAGPWADLVLGPLIAGGPDTALTGVWSRTAASAERVASRLGVAVFERFEQLIEASEALAIAVPPFAQPDLAVAAARAGRALLLEKPLARDVAGAERVTHAVQEAGVGSALSLTYRFVPGVRDLLNAAADWPAHGARACFVSGAFLGGPYAASAWRQEAGCLLDVGPHILDLVEVALGPVTSVRGRGDPHRSVSLVLEHGGGAVSEVLLTCRAAIEPSRTELELWGPDEPGTLAVDARIGLGRDSFADLVAAFVDAAREGRGATVDGRRVDAARGLELQRLLARAEEALR